MAADCGREVLMGWVFLINGIFTIAGLLNGLLWALLHGGRRIGRCLFLGWLCAVIPAWYYLWYAKGYSLLPDWTIWPAYILCGLMVANLIFCCLHCVWLFCLFRKTSAGDGEAERGSPGAGCSDRDLRDC